MLEESLSPATCGEPGQEDSAPLRLLLSPTSCHHGDRQPSAATNPKLLGAASLSSTKHSKLSLGQQSLKHLQLQEQTFLRGTEITRAALGPPKKHLLQAGAQNRTSLMPVETAEAQRAARCAGDNDPRGLQKV